MRIRFGGLRLEMNGVMLAGCAVGLVGVAAWGAGAAGLFEGQGRLAEGEGPFSHLTASDLCIGTGLLGMALYFLGRVVQIVSMHRKPE